MVLVPSTMLVLAAASTSPSPAKVPPAFRAVAVVMLAPAVLSLNSRFGESVADAAFSVNAAVSGAKIAGPTCRLTVVVCGVLAALPSLATHVMVRVGFEPWLVGSVPDE